MTRLQDKVAIVTGGASGLGKAISERFAAEGAHVVVADIQVEAGQAVAESLTLGDFMPVDVTEPDAVAAMVAKTVDRCDRLDIMVNNVEISGQQAPAANSTIERCSHSGWASSPGHCQIMITIYGEMEG